MRRLLSPFVLALTAILAAGYAYAAWRLTDSAGSEGLLVVPFVLVWIVPAVYCVYERESSTWGDDVLHAASYLCMGWLTYVLMWSIARDALLWITTDPLPAPRVHAVLVDGGAPAVFWGALATLGLGALAGLTSREGSYLVLGNHDYYSGAGSWVTRFEMLGMQVLRNEHRTIVRGQARLVIGGVVDPAVRLSDPLQAPRPDLASAPEVGRAFRLLLAHNPKLAPLAEQAGFELQLSGHTHAGQFFPWTLAVRLAHAPHVSGLSRCGRLWVYVSARTGSWGPPVRLGTRPELTLVRLVRVPSP